MHCRCCIICMDYELKEVKYYAESFMKNGSFDISYDKGRVLVVGDINLNWDQFRLYLDNYKGEVLIIPYESFFMNFEDHDTVKTKFLSKSR